MYINLFLLALLTFYTADSFSEAPAGSFFPEEALSETVSSKRLSPEDETAPYLLKDKLMNLVLDTLFANQENPLTPEHIQSLGFKFLNQLGLHVLVAKHPGFPGYVFKFFQYNTFPGIDWKYWIQRVKGAQLIQQGIHQFGYQKIFKVPKKWLYKTPCPQTIDGETYPSYILIAEDMRIVPLEENQKLWRKKTTENLLIALHKMIKTYGLRDCARITNVPWCKDSKIAFVDTETYYSPAVNYHPLIEFLSRKNKIRWENIVKGGGDPMSPN